VIHVDWKDGKVILTIGIGFLSITPSEAEELIDRLRQVLDERPEE